MRTRRYRRWLTDADRRTSSSVEPRAGRLWLADVRSWHRSIAISGCRTWRRISPQPGSRERSWCRPRRPRRRRCICWISPRPPSWCAASSAGRISTPRTAPRASMRWQRENFWWGCGRWYRTSPMTTGCLRPTLAPLLTAMVRHGLVFDALVLPRHLPRLLRVIDSHPDLAIRAGPLRQAAACDRRDRDLAARYRVARRTPQRRLQTIGPSDRGHAGLADCGSPPSGGSCPRRALGHNVCCGGATGRWSIWRAVMQNG